MSQTLIAAHRAHSAAQMLAAQVLAAKLPEPHSKYTVPIIVVFAVLAALAIIRKLIALALLAAIVAAVFVAYQSGAFNHWVDKGKQVIQQR